MSKVVFGRWEAIFLLINLINTQIFLSFPRSMADSAGTAGWILAIYIFILALIAFMILSKLYSPFEGDDLLDIAEKALGGAGRVIVGSIFVAYITFTISVVLREFGEDMKTITLNISPISFVILFFVIGMIAGSYMGIEAIVRIAAIVVPIISIGYYFIIAAVAPYYDVGNILPIFGSGTYDIFVKSLPKISTYSAMSILFFITPFLRTEQNFKKVGYIALVITGLNFIIGAFTYLMVYPYPVALENFLPVYQMARLINYGRFFQRVESIFVFIWAAGALIYLAAGFFFIVYIFKKTFKLKYYRPMIIPFAILVFNISLLPPSLIKSIRLESNFLRNYLWIITFVIPFLILSIARVRNRKKKKGGTANA